MFWLQGVFHHESIPAGKTMNKEMHIVVRRRLRIEVRRKLPEKWRTNSWFLLHDNAPAHRPVLVKDFLAKNNMTTMQHLPYSPDPAPVHFYLFPRLQSALKGRRFCYAIDNYECGRRAEKAFTKWLPGMFPSPLQSLNKVYTCTRGPIWRKCSLNGSPFCISQK